MSLLKKVDKAFNKLLLSVPLKTIEYSTGTVLAKAVKHLTALSITVIAVPSKYVIAPIDKFVVQRTPFMQENEKVFDKPLSQVYQSCLK